VPRGQFWDSAGVKDKLVIVDTSNLSDPALIGQYMYIMVTLPTSASALFAHIDLFPYSYDTHT
jgi:LVIVD repeat.